MNRNECPIPDAKGFCQPEGRGTLGVLMLGESLGDSEAHDNLPFRPYAPAGSVLERNIKRCGYSREQFVLYNAIPVQPPRNYINPKWEAAAIAWGLSILDDIVAQYKPRAILCLGGVPLRAVTGLAGEKLGVSDVRGYPLWSERYQLPVVATLHPSWLRRGKMAWSSVLMHDIKLAVAVAHGGGTFFSPVLNRDVTFKPTPHHDIYSPFIPGGYVEHPTEADAWRFYEEAEKAKLIAYDIETPRSKSADEDESDELGETVLLSVQFSVERGTGIFLPWRDPFIEVAKRTLALGCDKAGANTWRFDDPLLAAHGAPVRGKRHDVRWAWQHFQPDLSGALQSIMSFYNRGSWMPWKHLHSASPQAYGIMDVDAIQYILG